MHLSICEISQKSSSASTGGKIPPQEGGQLKIYELCRTPRKLWYLQSLFLPLPKKIKTFIDQYWSRNRMYQKFLQIHNPYPISSCGPSFQCHLKLFRRAFLSSRSSPGLTIQPKRSSTRGESLFSPTQIKENVLWNWLACHLRWIRILCLFTGLAGKAKPRTMPGQIQSTVIMIFEML